MTTTPNGAGVVDSDQARNFQPHHAGRARINLLAIKAWASPAPIAVDRPGGSDRCGACPRL